MKEPRVFGWDMVMFMVACAFYTYCMRRAVDEVGIHTTLMITTGFLITISLIKNWSKLR